MDPLSDVLSILKPRSSLVGGLDAGGDWSVRFGPHEGIKCYAVVRGDGWLAVDGVAEAVRLTAGDCFLLPRGWPFRLAGDLALPSLDFHACLTMPRLGGLIPINGGGDFAIVGAFFALSGDPSVLLTMLPPIVHLRQEADKAALRWSLDRMRQELHEQQPGGTLVAQHLADMMLVQALRLHLAEGAKDGVGWLFALADRQMSAAIAAMHADPGHRWTLQGLAARAGMSRSSFAQKFKATVGTAPMDYLTRWRMLRAADRLANTRDPIAAVALSLGYESESAFSTAFKRVVGCSPRRYDPDRPIRTRDGNEASRRAA